MGPQQLLSVHVTTAIAGMQISMRVQLQFGSLPEADEAE